MVPAISVVHNQCPGILQLELVWGFGLRPLLQLILDQN